MAIVKVPYVCGPLTELEGQEREAARMFYEAIADTCQQVLGVRAFVPHEHYDPVLHAGFTPQQVYAAERDQVCNQTSALIVVPLAGSWGGGIEVEMAYRSRVPIFILCDSAKLEARKISRLLRGNPGITETIVYETHKFALDTLAAALRAYKIPAVTPALTV